MEKKEYTASLEEMSFKTCMRNARMLFGDPVQEDNVRTWISETEDGRKFTVTCNMDEPDTFTIHGQDIRHTQAAYRQVTNKLEWVEEQELRLETLEYGEVIYREADRRVMQLMLKYIPNDGDTAMVSTDGYTSRPLVNFDAVDGYVVSTYWFAGLKNVGGEIRVLGCLRDPCTYEIDLSEYYEFPIEGIHSDRKVFDIMRMFLHYYRLSRLQYNASGKDAEAHRKHLELVPNIGDEYRVEEEYLTDYLTVTDSEDGTYIFGGLKRTGEDDFSVLCWTDGLLVERTDIYDLQVTDALLRYYHLKYELPANG